MNLIHGSSRGAFSYYYYMLFNVDEDGDTQGKMLRWRNNNTDIYVQNYSF